MKKRILQIACFILTLLMLPVQAFAYTGQMDAEQLSGAAAIKRVEENANFVGSELRTVTTDKEEKLFYRVETYTETSAIAAQTEANARSSEASAASYETTTYEVWTPLSSRSSGSVWDEEYDNYGYMLLSLTVYFTDLSYNGGGYRRMDRVAGSYTIVTGGVEMQSHSYTLREWGVSYPSGGPSTQTRTYTLPRMAFSWNEAVDNSVFPGIQTFGASQYQVASYNYTVSSITTGGTWSGELTVQSFTFQ